MSLIYCPDSGELRIYSRDGAELASATVRPWTATVAGLAELKGSLDRRHLRRIAGLLRGRGIKTVYVPHAPHRKLPYARRIERGDFAGMWRIDLVAVRD